MPFQVYSRSQDCKGCGKPLSSAVGVGSVIGIANGHCAGFYHAGCAPPLDVKELSGVELLNMFRRYCFHAGDDFALNPTTEDEDEQGARLEREIARRLALVGSK